MINALYWLLVLIGFLIMLVASTYLLKWLHGHNININRWIWAVSSFLVVVIPTALIGKVNLFGNIILYGLCALFAINFMIEQHQWFVNSNL